MYKNDSRVVMTLDAGGTNLVFTAIRGCEQIVDPIGIPTVSDTIEGCLATIVKGFEAVKEKLDVEPVAISFAFPGPADYKNGVLGDLPNFPSFRGGVALGPYLQKHFGLPVFINNDVDLFTYGEALAGALPELNAAIKAQGGTHTYKNLFGCTFGTGFGGGIVIDGKLLSGDNSAGGDVWCFRNKKYPNMIAEEGVSVRAVPRVYGELSGEDTTGMTPKDVFDVAEGKRPGNVEAAKGAFAQLGETAGNVIAEALTLIDGVCVIGGGISASHKYYMPALMAELEAKLGRFAGDEFPRMQTKVFYLQDFEDLSSFVNGASVMVKIPGTTEYVPYDKEKRSAVMVSKLGASKAICIGAYVFALSQIDAE